MYKDLPKKISDFAMTTFEAIKEEGKKEGKREGRKEGILIEKRNTILSLKKEFPDWSLLKIAKFTNTSEKFVNQILSNGQKIIPRFRLLKFCFKNSRLE